MLLKSSFDVDIDYERVFRLKSYDLFINVLMTVIITRGKKYYHRMNRDHTECRKLPKKKTRLLENMYPLCTCAQMKLVVYYYMQN